MIYMKDYVSLIYNETRTPRTEYPFKLASYLFHQFKLNKKNKLLEIGCGRGEFLASFKQLGLDCYGVDISSFSYANLTGVKVEKVDVSQDTFSYEDNSFDIVYHKSLIEHLYSPDHLMKETYRILKPGGRVIILTPDWVSQIKVFYEDFTHSRPYDLTSLSDLLHIYGFSEVESKLFYQLPILWYYPWLKILSCFLRIFISTPTARRLTKISGIRFFRWSVELMVLGTGIK